MAVLSPSFLFGVVALLYLLSFVFFAIVRIATGVSIQRFGYFSLRRIAYTPRDGIRIDLRGLGLRIHRPTFARPTYISLRLTELRVTFDPSTRTDPKARPSAPPSPKPDANGTKDAPEQDAGGEFAHNDTWRKLTQLKETIKALHNKIRWLSIVDLEITDIRAVVPGVGEIQVGSMTAAIDTRRQTVDRNRLFRHKKEPEQDKSPAEWMFVIKGVLFTPDGSQALEIIDILTLNVHGLLYRKVAGLRDVSVSLKIGRVNIPFDQIVDCRLALRRAIQESAASEPQPLKRDISFDDLVAEFEKPGSREESIVRTVTESREFMASLLRGIQEIQLGVSFVGFTKKIEGVQPNGRPVYANISMNEIGVDLFRLDQKSPAHRMYFSPGDVAHQALIAAISLAVGIDDGQGKSERILYVPMATSTIKTTLPSRTISAQQQEDAAARNANMLFANFAVTSPSIDIGLKHITVILALLQARNPSNPSPTRQGERQRLISRLLPKANVRLSVQEPVARVVLPPADKSLRSTDEYDLLISSISSISLGVDSSHSSGGDLHYALTSSLRITSEELYYQTAQGARHNLLLVDTLGLKVQLAATPEVSAVIEGNLDTVSAHLVRPEIGKGIYKILQQIRTEPTHQDKAEPPRPNVSFLRRLPPWIVHFQFKGSNFGIEVAGTDEDVSEHLRGLALQLQTWNVDYKLQKSVSTRSFRPRSELSGSISPDEAIVNNPFVSARKKVGVSTDGRKLAIQIQGFEGYIVEGVDAWEPHAFLSVPRAEVSFTTATDHHGQMFHIHAHSKTIYIQYSLYRYYAVGIATNVLRRAFQKRHSADTYSQALANPTPITPQRSLVQMPTESITIDVRTPLIQVKATMPSDPPIMLQIYGLDYAQHRWATPFLRTQLIRLYAEAPRVKNVWARIVSMKSARVDIRKATKIVGKEAIADHSIDVQTDFIRLAVPHQLVMYRIMDNFVNTVKATEQLNHRFMTETNTYVLQKGPEGPKKIPKVSVRSRTLMFELEDSSFDWRLDLIYRVGMKEQKQRLARDEAYRLKVKKLAEQQSHRREQARGRQGTRKPRGWNAPSTNANEADLEDDAKSFQSRSRGRRRSSWGRGHDERYLHYDADASCVLTGDAKITADEALLALQEYNAASWKKRISFAMRNQSNSMKEYRRNLWGDDDLPEDAEEPEPVIAIPSRPGLMMTLINDFHITIDKPSFPIDEYPKFLHDLGKGMPFDTKYSLLIPMHVQLNMGETKMTLRNYPLPLVHVPALKSGQSARLPSWSLKTDFVIAEEFRDSESIRHVKVEIVPPAKITEPPQIAGGFAIDVQRTVSPVKTYSNIDVVVNTKNPTTFTWGTAYQPAIQDMMQTIESFTRPMVDPSEKVGFWDKIRLSFHSRARIAWTGGGDVHLKLKGTRDPYRITGSGAGFVWCFRQGVRWDLHQTDDPREFMTVSCGEYVWAIPDYSEQARFTDYSGSNDSESVHSSRTAKAKPEFRKVVMKLSGNVRWLAGLVFERETGDATRTSEFCKHFEVTTKTPDAAKKYMPDYDAFRNFRSQHIHLSLAVIAPVDRDWSVRNQKPSSGYNTAHLSPRFFTHFFDWWSTFQGSLQLPVRQGPLFPGVEKSSKKFGRHLATIKYNLLLSPLFLAHIYKHKDADEFNDDVIRATGLKVKLDSFMLDMHQRRETFATQKKAKGKSGMTSGMKINQAQLDFVNADFRAVSSTISGVSPQIVKRGGDDLSSLLTFNTSPSQDTSAFTIPDNDLIWVDMDDFVELDWVLPAERHPAVKIMPLAFSPRFTYFRQTEHNGMVSGDATRSSNFGDEQTHFCVMSQDNDPRHVQRDLVSERIAIVETQIEELEKSIRVQAQKVQDDAPESDELNEDYEELRRQGDMLLAKKTFMEKMLADLGSAPKSRRRGISAGGESLAPSLSELANEAEATRSRNRVDSRPIDYASDFNNRFTVHNVQLKWNNSLRDIILRYVHQVSQRRGFTYYMTRSAVKFILDILEEQQRKHKRTTPKDDDSESKTPRDASQDYSSQDVSDELRDRIDELVKDGKNFVNAEDERQQEDDSTPEGRQRRKEKAIAEEFTAVDSYHVRLIAPQIQLQSEKNPRSVLLVTARGMELKVIQIMDKSRIADDISGLVQRRFLIDMDRVQFFVTNQREISYYLKYYTHLKYGAPKGTVWPPWAPLEVNFDSHLSPFGWFRVVEETSINLKYEKYNNLRLKYNNEVTESDVQSQSHTPEESEQRIDHISVEFPQMKAICDSSQYYSLFVIVSDLLLYSEPLEKKRNERLEKIMLAADFSDLSGAPEMIIGLQDRIHQLEEIQDYFQLHSDRLERQGWEDRLAIEHDLSICQEELFFMMKAITSSQRKIEDRAETEANGLLRWNISAQQLVWHLVREQNEPLAEFQLRNAMFDRTDNSDGSNHNLLEIGQIFGLNLMKEAIYPQMIAPYDPRGIESAWKRIEEGDITMLKVNWHMLEAIAGIPVLSNFEVNLFPLNIQLEQHAGKKLFEYVFPPGNGDGQGQSPFMAKHRPTMTGDDESDVDLSIPDSPNSSEPYSFEPDTRAGSMELRLRPTLHLTETRQASTATSAEPNRRRSEQLANKLGLFPARGSKERERSTSRSRASIRSVSTRSSSKRAGADDVSMTSKLVRDESASNLSGVSSRTSERTNRFGIRRSNTTKSSNADKEKPNDDLTEMMSRASNYMTLAYVKIPSVVLCLSYKGKGERNFVDVHDFVFTMPTIEYRNKTWSNMDLVLRLKKDVIKALISHTGAIIGNKFSHRGPSKNQQSKLRELASSSTLLPNTNITNKLVRTATTFRHLSVDKGNRHESYTETVQEEQESEEVSLAAQQSGDGSNGVALDGTSSERGNLPKVAINGRTFHITSPNTSESRSMPNNGSSEDVSASAFPERPSTRPTTKDSGAEPDWQTPKSMRSAETGSSVDDDASSTRRTRKSQVINFGKKILSSVK